MPYRVEVQIEAIKSLQAAFDWYEEQKEGLGFDFIDEIEVCYENLSKHPERYAYINHTYRRIKPERFPYILVYEIEDERVIIINVRHIKQKPL
jgi:toxin ParE1/3/4